MGSNMHNASLVKISIYLNGLSFELQDAFLFADKMWVRDNDIYIPSVWNPNYPIDQLKEKERNYQY